MIAIRKLFQMNGMGFAEESPRFLSRKHEDRCDQANQRVEDIVNDGLRGATSMGRGGVAVHSIFGDVDVKATQFYRAKLIDAMVNLMELVLVVRITTLLHELLESGFRPSIDEGKIRNGIFRRIEVI